MIIHFIGIGGIGISSLAQYYLAKGNKVSGSDLAESETTKALQKKGVKIFIDHKAENVPENVDLVIYTPATPKNNPELKEAKSLKIKNLRAKRMKFSSSASLRSEARQLKILSYPQALGELTKEYFTIAVCGTHGKSTTTAMISLILIKAGLNPTVIIGTKLKEFGNSNFRMGGRPNHKSQAPNPKHQIPNHKILVIEADEHFASFLNYWPQIIVLTNIDRDHLDYYKNLKNILKAFKEFISHLPKNGYLIVNKDDKNIKKLLSQKMSTNRRSSKKRHYSLSQGRDKKRLEEILKVPGEHNIQNALAALTCARVLKVPDKISFEALSKYQGAWRRFEEHDLKIKNLNLKIISDYGHHPTEIKATLKAAREKFPGKRIILIFQPHQHQRTKFLFKDFVKSFDETDILILTEIYGVAGREKGEKLSSKDLAMAIEKRWNKRGKRQEARGKKSVVFIKDMEDIPDFLTKILKPNDVVMIMGAGNIYNLFLRLHQGEKNNLS
jgi:UDP-N-acetylmuramate--alanine ligase